MRANIGFLTIFFLTVVNELKSAIFTKICIFSCRKCWFLSDRTKIFVSGLSGQNINISGHVFLVMFSGLSGWKRFF